MRIDKLLNEANLFKRRNKGLSPDKLFFEFDSFTKLDEVDACDKPKAMRKLMLTFEIDDDDDINTIKLLEQAENGLQSLSGKQWENIQKAITMSKNAKNKKP